MRILRNPNLRPAVVLLLALLSAPALLWAAPLALSNQAPLARLYGVPAALPAQLLAPGATQWQLTSTLANTFSKDTTHDEAIFLDGESEELRLQWRHGIVRGTTALEFGAMLPWVHHGSGILDHTIVEFHDLAGLPQGNRTKFEADRLRYAYRDGDRLLLEFEDSGAALGDLQLSAGWALLPVRGHTLALRLHVKLPTGDADRLTGSGATDVAAALHMSHTLLGGELDVAAGVAALGKGDVLRAKQRDVAAYGHAAWAYPWSADVGAIVQLGFNSAFYQDTDLAELNGAAWLGLGARYRIANEWALDLALIEDVMINSTPDVGFQLALRYTP